jgi:hypothetical protein
MLAQVPVPGLTGIQVAPTANAGSVSNKGGNLTYRTVNVPVCLNTSWVSTLVKLKTMLKN